MAELLNAAAPLLRVHVRVQNDDFDPGRELTALTEGRHDVGGVAAFVGLTREFAHDRRLIAMTIEHYPGMTERQLARLAEDAVRRWSLAAVAIVHRHGRLLPGERIVLVATAARHREPAFEACRFLIDQLKTRAPLWKAEETPAGRHWVQGRAGDDEAATAWDAPSDTPLGEVRR